MELNDLLRRSITGKAPKMETVTAVRSPQFATKPKNNLPEPEALPARAGRQTVIASPNFGLFTNLREGLGTIEPDFDFEVIRLCTHLAKFNGDISYAVDNVVQLGNTPATITFTGPDAKNKGSEILDYIKEAEKLIYPGGMNSLQNDLFAQVWITGALSAEKIAHRSLNYVDKVALVAPLYIRWAYNKDKATYEPYQKPPNMITDGMIKLNPVTYTYLALRRFDDNPYAIPPMASAFESMDLEKDMLKNVKHIVKKMGLFGFLSVLVTAPNKLPGETPDAYYQRAQSHLEQMRPEIEKGYASGITLGYKNSLEFKMEGANANTDGAKELLDVIIQMKAAGIKQDPLMLGRNFNVAETMARVIMAKLTTQVANVQRLVATFRGDLYVMMAQLAGYRVVGCDVEYDPPMIGDKLRDEQAYAAKIANTLELRNSGIINQSQAANILGYNSPFAAKDVDYSVLNAADKSKERQAKAASKDATNPNKTKDKDQANDATAEGATAYRSLDFISLNAAKRKLHGGVAEFQYDDHSCGHHRQNKLSLARKKKTPSELQQDEFEIIYDAEIRNLYSKAVGESIDDAIASLAELPATATEQEIIDAVMYALYTRFQGSFVQEIIDVVAKNVDTIYRYFREDKSIFPDPNNIPDIVFNLHDANALEYFNASDRLYLGKFITDDDTNRRITEYLKETYINKGFPVGNSPEMIEQFRQNFAGVLQGEAWKIRRVIDTAVSMMRNYASVAYMMEADVATFEYVGINDGLQCGYCRHMDGMTFSVAKAYDKTDQVVTSMPAFVSTDKPFVTAVFKGGQGLEQFKQLDSEAIESYGVTMPPVHPHCRCNIVAKDFVGD